MAERIDDRIEIAAGQQDGPVSVSVTRRIKPGCERAFEELVKGIHEAIKGFDGYLGSDILKPAAPGHAEYRIIFRFATARHLSAWERSPERREWLDRMNGMIVGQPVYQTLTGLEAWFTLPGCGPLVAPPRYKMTVVTWIAVFPLLTGFNYALQPVFAGVPLWLRVLISVTIVVPAMTYLVMPRMTRLFRSWLYPDGTG